MYGHWQITIHDIDKGLTLKYIQHSEKILNSFREDYLRCRMERKQNSVSTN